MMNMGRVAAGGRNWEGFGADPYLVGEMAIQAVLGLQSQGVIATAKHYILNEQEHFRTLESSNIDDRTIHEIYGWPFMRSVGAGVGSIMCSYNQINGVYACENNRTLNQILKGEWGFRGFVMSDWSATMSTLPSIFAGLDQTMPGDITFQSGDSYYGQNLTTVLNNNVVSQDKLNDMATRILTPYFLLNQDSDYPSVDIDFRNESIPGLRNVQSDHADIIRTVGVESAVLLKNKNNVLPFPSTAGLSFALIGSDAGPNPDGVNSCSDKGCNIGHLAIGWGSGTVLFPYLVTPLDGISDRANSNSQTVSSSLNDTDLSTAQQLASTSTYALVFVTADSGEGYITVEGNEGDRNDLVLWHGGDQLIEAVAAVNNNTVVVINAVGPVLLPWIDHPNVSAVIFAGLPGQESGNALADILFGDANPSGKLVFTIGKQESDYSAQVIYTSTEPILQIPYTEALLIDYRWFDSQNIAPTFPFGHGLSYTTFQYSNLQITNTSINSPYTVLANESVIYTISADIKNNGTVGGAEVAQLYLGFPAGAGEPPKVLRGFDKVFIAAGDTQTVSFDVTNLELGIWDSNLQLWNIPPGTFTVYVGSSSRDIRLTSHITPVSGSIGTTTGSTTGRSGGTTTSGTGSHGTTGSSTSNPANQSSLLTVNFFLFVCVVLFAVLLH
eukprot:TRINITY_DN3649_c0_g2_i3.p1 TRINITY_DN3649_c0_g2~~TRINITY_DN3649_c0_g2_i3.p1  ORF type:complete len:668 (-),score=145.17 TRINITY_DN3649_c0_g2_i3:136-2139(-)